MSATHKKCKIDFGCMVAGSREVLGDVKNIDDKVREIKETMMGYRCKADSESYNRLFNKCSKETLEVLLTCRLGLEGVDCLRASIQLVPEQYLSKRPQVICNIVNKVLEQTNKVPMTFTECECSCIH